MNLVSGYKGKPRVFEIETVVGVGWGHSFASTTNLEENAVLTKVGMNLNFNLGKSKAWTIGVKPAVVWNLNKNAFISNYDINRAGLQLQAGVTYNFKGSNDAHHFTYCNKVATQEEVDALNKKINQLRGALQECQERPIEVQEVYVEKVVIQNRKVLTPTIIQFTSGSDAIPSTSDAAIKALAMELLVSGQTCTLNGYASVDGDEAKNPQTRHKNACFIISFQT
jgi:hypothetical protein